MFQGDECARGMSVLGDGCLGGWEFLLPERDDCQASKNSPLAEGVPVCMRCTLSYSSYY